MRFWRHTGTGSPWSNAARARSAAAGPLATEADLDRAATPYLERIAAAGTYPHFSRWAADPQRDAAPFPRFEQILDWLLDGLARTLTLSG